jgi:hypothetical protein
MSVTPVSLPQAVGGSYKTLPLGSASEVLCPCEKQKLENILTIILSIPGDQDFIQAH